MYEAWKHFEKGQSIVCDYCTQETARIGHDLWYNLILLKKKIKNEKIGKNSKNCYFWDQLVQKGSAWVNHAQNKKQIFLAEITKQITRKEDHQLIET